MNEVLTVLALASILASTLMLIDIFMTGGVKKR